MSFASEEISVVIQRVFIFCTGVAESFFTNRIGHLFFCYRIKIRCATFQLLSADK